MTLGIALIIMYFIIVGLSSLALYALSSKDEESDEEEDPVYGETIFDEEASDDTEPPEQFDS